MAHSQSQRGKRPFRLGIRRYSAVELLISLGVLIFAAPFLEGLDYGRVVDGILLTVVILSAALAVGVERRTLITAILLGVPAAAGRWTAHFHQQAWAGVFFLASAMVFLGFIIVHILRFVLRTRHVNAEVLCASISAYLMLGLLWAMAYRLVEVVTPTAFSFTTPQAGSGPMQGFTAFYFSFVTLSTVGYGDIAPVSKVARMLTVIEAMTGTMYVAVLIARLVSLYSIREIEESVADSLTPEPAGTEPETGAGASSN